MIGYDKPLYVLPFDHRASFSKELFGWQGQPSPDQTAQIAAVKRVIFDIVELYSQPKLTTDQVRAAFERDEFDPLKAFSLVCRAELLEIAGTA